MFYFSISYEPIKHKYKTSAELICHKIQIENSYDAFQCHCNLMTLLVYLSDHGFICLIFRKLEVFILFNVCY